jgi:RHS repeat-associated protein
MPIAPRQNLLCSYRYDALDRSIYWTQIQQAGIQRFHCKDRLATEIQGPAKHSIFQHDDHVLAQRQHMDDKVDITLLTTDLQGSVLNALDAHRSHPIAYTPYGYRLPSNGLLSLLGFNGERPDPVTGHYHLGHGYRQFNPVLMRFNSPDSLSPFGKGGLNAYGYCGANPVTNIDPSGRTVVDQVIKKMTSRITLRTGRSGIAPETERALKDTFPLNYSDNPKKYQEQYIRVLLREHQIRQYDKEVLLAYQSAPDSRAAKILPLARRNLQYIDKRTIIVKDADDGGKNFFPSRAQKEIITYRANLYRAIRDLETKANNHRIHMASEASNSVRTGRSSSPNLDNPPSYEEAVNNRRR